MIMADAGVKHMKVTQNDRPYAPRDLLCMKAMWEGVLSGATPLFVSSVKCRLCGVGGEGVITCATCGVTMHNRCGMTHLLDETNLIYLEELELACAMNGLFFF